MFYFKFYLFLILVLFGTTPKNPLTSPTSFVIFLKQTHKVFHVGRIPGGTSCKTFRGGSSLKFRVLIPKSRFTIKKFRYTFSVSVPTIVVNRVPLV